MQGKVIYLFANPLKPNVRETVSQVSSLLEQAGAQVVLEPWLMGVSQNARYAPLEALPEETAALIALGGDGTLLRAAPFAVRQGVPMLGLHTGTVGFLMEANIAAAQDAVTRLMEGRYFLDERILLSIAQPEISPSLALNDCSITRGEHPGVLSVSVYADDEKVYDLTGDGVLVSTPTGATAYALAAGAPIMRPDVPCLLITPLCARELLAKPVLVPACARITLRVRTGEGRRPQLSLDGQYVRGLTEDATITLVSAKERALFIRFDKHSFFEQLRIKQALWNHLEV